MGIRKHFITLLLPVHLLFITGCGNSGGTISTIGKSDQNKANPPSQMEKQPLATGNLTPDKNPTASFPAELFVAQDFSGREKQYKGLVKTMLEEMQTEIRLDERNVVPEASKK